MNFLAPYSPCLRYDSDFFDFLAPYSPFSDFFIGPERAAPAAVILLLRAALRFLP